MDVLSDGTRIPKKVKPKRLAVSFHPTLIKEIKVNAATRGISMKHYVMQAIIEKMTRDKQYE